MGRGLLPGRSWRLPKPVLIVSERSAKTKPLGIVAPRRFNMIAWGIATTSALTTRAPCGHGVTTCGAAGAVLGVAVFAFTGSASALTVAVGVSSFVFERGACAFFGADSGAAALESTAAFSTVATGVWAAMIDALIKIRVIAANQMTNSLGANLRPSISCLLYTSDAADERSSVD